MNLLDMFNSIDIKKEFPISSILILLFLFGGFYYVTPHKIGSNAEKIEKHNRQLQKQNDRLDQVQNQIMKNAVAIQAVQSNYISSSDLKGYVTRPILDDLKALISEIQKSQDRRLQRIEQRIDYLIKNTNNEYGSLEGGSNE